jgi:hypothetical protein
VGRPVSLTKRVSDIAGPGQVLVTELVKLHVAGSGIVLSEVGSHILKGVPGERLLHRASWPL